MAGIPESEGTSGRPGTLRRAWHRLRSPSARWPVLALVAVGAVVGALAIIGTQVMVHVTGTDEFCGGACHSMQWEEKFNNERMHMATQIWTEYRANDSRACRGCHQFSEEVLAKQQEMVRPIHAPVLEGKATCIDCHKGVGHAAP